MDLWIFVKEISGATLTGKLQPSGGTQDLRPFKQYFTLAHQKTHTHTGTINMETGIFKLAHQNVCYYTMEAYIFIPVVFLVLMMLL